MASVPTENERIHRGQLEEDDASKLKFGEGKINSFFIHIICIINRKKLYISKSYIIFFQGIDNCITIKRNYKNLLKF